MRPSLRPLFWHWPKTFGTQLQILSCKSKNGVTNREGTLNHSVCSYYEGQERRWLRNSLFTPKYCAGRHGIANGAPHAIIKWSYLIIMIKDNDQLTSSLPLITSRRRTSSERGDYASRNQQSSGLTSLPGNTCEFTWIEFLFLPLTWSWRSAPKTPSTGWSPLSQSYHLIA